MTASAAPGPSLAARIWRRAMANGLPMYVGGLIFLGFSLIPAWVIPNSLSTRIVVTAVSLWIGIIYITIPLVVESSLRIRLVWVGLLTLGLAVGAFEQGVAIIYFSPYLSIALAALLAWSANRIILPVLIMLLVAIGLWSGDWLAVSLALMGGLMGIWMALGMRQAALRRELVSVQEHNAVLAVAAERERIGWDLHDILGHSLTAVAVKAQLARRLAERDPVRAAAEMAEVERLARQALTEVRATASGMREVRLVSETASARSVLGAAGIECRVTAAATVPDLASSELLGYVVREAVTNVVRHSGAERCEIEMAEDGVRIHDDGSGMTAPPGNGLRGLRERVEEAGGTLLIHGGPGTTIEARLGVRR